MATDNLVTVKVYESTRADVKKAAAILGVQMIDLFRDAVVEKIQKELPGIEGIWETVPPPK